MKKAKVIEIRFVKPIIMDIDMCNTRGINALNHDSKAPKGSSIIFIVMEAQWDDEELLYDVTSQYIMVRPGWLKEPRYHPVKESQVSFYFPFHNILQLMIEEKIDEETH